MTTPKTSKKMSRAAELGAVAFDAFARAAEERRNWEVRGTAPWRGTPPDWAPLTSNKKRAWSAAALAVAAAVDPDGSGSRLDKIRRLLNLEPDADVVLAVRDVMRRLEVLEKHAEDPERYCRLHGVEWCIDCEKRCEWCGDDGTMLERDGDRVCENCAFEHDEEARHERAAAASVDPTDSPPSAAKGALS